jgi:hypothetical protein
MRLLRRRRGCVALPSAGEGGRGSRRSGRVPLRGELVSERETKSQEASAPDLPKLLRCDFASNGVLKSQQKPLARTRARLTPPLDAGLNAAVRRQPAELAAELSRSATDRQRPQRGLSAVRARHAYTSIEGGGAAGAPAPPVRAVAFAHPARVRLEWRAQVEPDAECDPSHAALSRVGLVIRGELAPQRRRLRSRGPPAPVLAIGNQLATNRSHDVANAASPLPSPAEVGACIPAGKRVMRTASCRGQLATERLSPFSDSPGVLDAGVRRDGLHGRSKSCQAPAGEGGVVPARPGIDMRAQLAPASSRPGALLGSSAPPTPKPSPSMRQLTEMSAPRPAPAIAIASPRGREMLRNRPLNGSMHGPPTTRAQTPPPGG